VRGEGILLLHRLRAALLALAGAPGAAPAAPPASPSRATPIART
jgi:hypothetical protein